jgi:hypothetical protein
VPPFHERALASSIAETLRTGLAQRRPDLDDDLARGLEVIERRAAALARFMQSYARLVRLPPPRLAPVDVAGWLRRTAALKRVTVIPGPEVAVAGDADQLDQLLINLVRNAVEANPEGVRLSWSVAPGTATIVVEDEARASAIPRTCSCRSSRRSPAAPASASCSRGRSPRRIAAASSCGTARRGAAPRP